MTEDTAEILAAHEAWQAAVAARDAGALDALIWDGLVYQHASGRVQDKAAYIADIVNRGRRAELTELQAHRFGETGVVTCLQPAAPGPSNVDVRILFVWARQDGAWRLAARQAMAPRSMG
jgi:ketosteroid isomerase-like protein